MPDFEKMYFELFNTLSKAIEHIEEMNFGSAKGILIAAQQSVEETKNKIADMRLLDIKNRGCKILFTVSF